MFKQVRINILLLDVIQRLSAYAKFLKDLCIVKRKNNVPQKAFLTEKVNSILLNKIHTKYKYPSLSQFLVLLETMHLIELYLI